MPVLPGESTSSTYGVPFADSSPVEDPTTDMSAAQGNAALSDTAAMTHTVARAYIVLTGVTAAAPTVTEHNSNWGSANAVVPTIVANGTGDSTITWPATVTAEDGTTATLNLKRCVGWNIEGATPFFVTVTPVTANTMRVRVFTSGAAASDYNTVKLTIYVR